MDSAQLASRLALQNNGVFTSTTAAAGGLTRHQIAGLIAREILVVPHRGVYRLAAFEESFETRCRAAVLAAGDDAVIDRLSAARLHELWTPDDRSECEVPRPITIAVPGTGGRVLKGVDVVRRSVLTPADRTRLDGIPVTTATRTVADCAALLSGAALGGLLDEALRSKRTALPRIRVEEARLRSRGRPGSGRFTAVVAERLGETQPSNGFERKVSALLVSRGLPPPTKQHEVVLATGRSRFVDLAYPDAMVGLEPAGWKWHLTRAQWASDLTRNNELTALGWRMMPIPFDDYRQRPDVVVRDVRGALKIAGCAGRAATG